MDIKEECGRGGNKRRGNEKSPYFCHAAFAEEDSKHASFVVPLLLVEDMQCLLRVLARPSEPFWCS